MVEKARDLCKDLIENVREQYEEFRSRPPRQHGDRGGYGDRGYGGDRRGGDRYNDRGGDHYSGRGGGGGGDSYSSYGRQNSDSGSRGAAAGADSSAANADYNAQYAQYYAQAAANGQDPYAAYGGYAKYDMPLYILQLPLANRLSVTSPCTSSITLSMARLAPPSHQLPARRHLPLLRRATQHHHLLLRVPLLRLLRHPDRPLAPLVATVLLVPSLNRYSL